MKLGSLFDGSGGFPLAGALVGIKPVWASEIEPYPLRVTAARFPDMKQLGDVTKINGAQIEPVDVITFGSPCQDLSTAGKQAGIHEGKRSCLFFEAIRIIKEMREATHGEFPKYLVFENVPGLFSSNRGEDFRAVLEAFVETIEWKHIDVPRPDKWRGAGSIRTDHGSVAWRVLNAQYFGVAQRRRRVFVVASLTDSSAEEILFERKGMRGIAETRRTIWDEPSGNAAEHADRNAPVVTAYSDIGFGSYSKRQTTGPLRANGGHLNAGDGSILEITGVNHKRIVRRLTPLECCRLQGFPDWWEDGVKGSDTERYRMWGNGVALPCVKYVMEGIANG